MRNHVHGCLVMAVLVLAAPAANHAQVTSGTPPFGAITGSTDKVDLGNLNVHNDFAIFHKAGRGLPFSFNFGNDSALWFPAGSNGTKTWYPQSTFGWVGSGTNIGTIGYALITGSGFFEYCYFTYFDGFGTSHLFPGCAAVSGGVDYPLTTYTQDGTGYKLQADACGILQNNICYLVFSLTSVDGSGIIPQNSTPVISSSGAASGSIIDRNGNQITANTNGTFTDTLGTTPLTNTGGFPPNPNNQNPPPAPSPYVMSYISPAGTTASATLTYKPYTLRTNFGCSNVGDFGVTTAYSNYFPDKITLADGTFYQFTYELTPGYATSITGRLASVTLPTGGKITYSYTGGNNGIFCSDGSISGLTRTTPDGTWTYTRTQGSGAASTTVVTDPHGNQTVIQFQGIYETQRQVYQLISGTQTLLETVYTCYNGSASPCTGTAVSLPITSKSVITQDGTRQSKKVTLYDPTHGVLLEEDDYDYGLNAPGALLKKTVYTYASFTGGNINSLPATITVCAPGGTAAACNNSGTVVAQTTKKYDETAVTPTTGTPQLVNIGSSPRGNLTTTQTLVQGTTTLSKHFSYYDTGNIQTVTDVNGTQQPSFTYGTGSCGNSFPTSISEGLGLTKSMTWNCTGGVQTSVTDENGKTITTAYTDKYFWRPSSVTDRTNAVNSLTYNNQTSFEASLPFNSNNSAIDILGTLDSLGRNSLAQTRQGPGATTFDTIETDYDGLGRPSRVTLPFSGTAGQHSTTAPAVVTSYDALGRILSKTDASGGSVSYTYSQNDVLIAAGPAPTGESVKQRQLEFDGLGRLSSVCEITNATGSATCGQSVTKIGYWTKYTYDALGNLTGVTQNAQTATAQQQTRSFTYDGLSRLTSEANPESGTTTYAYDSDTTCGISSPGDRIRRVDAVGNTTCYTYDALHRNTSIGYSGPYSDSQITPSKFFVYDSATVNGQVMQNAKGRLAEAYTGPATSKLTDVGFSYSARGEVWDIYQATSHSGGYYHLNETYWANGVPSQLSGNLGVPTLNYGVDGEGRNNSASTSTLTLVTGTIFNAASQPTQLNLGTGDSDAYGYDSNTTRMAQYKFIVDSQAVFGNLTWNANATLQTLAVTDPFNASNNQTCTYGYDDLNRLSSVGCRPPGSATASTWQQSFSYDAFGNISKSGSMSFQPTYTDLNGHTSNKYTSVPGCTVSYDANGNVLNDCVHTYTWDAEGRPITMDGVGVTYDALKRMVEQNRSGAHTQIVYAPTGEKFALMNGQTLQKAYVPLPGRVTAIYTSTGFSYYRHKDWLGSSRFASTVTTAATAGMGTGTVNGSEQSFGGGTPGTGTVTIGGGEQSKLVCDPSCDPTCRLRSCGTTIYDFGTVRATVNGHTDSANYDKGSTTSSIASALASAINADSGSFVTASVSANVITLTAKTVGSGTNYTLSTSVSYDTTDFSHASFTATPSGATLTGGTTGTPTYDTGSVWVTINGVQITASYGQNDTALTVASSLTNAINGNSSSPVSATVSGSLIVLVSKTKGAGTNYSLASGSSSSQPANFSSPSFTVALSGSALTGGSATATSMYSSTAYAPFGEAYAQAGTADASFTGLNQDTSGGLYDADAREYSTQGRWPSPDPAGLSSMHLSDPRSLNRYAYARNNPVNLSDPSGNDPCDWFGGCDLGGWGGGGFGCDWDPSCFAGSLPNPIGGLPDPFGISNYPMPGMGCDWGCLTSSDPGDPANARDPINSDPIKKALADLFKNNPNCAAAWGGLDSALNLLNKMATVDVPYYPWAGGGGGWSRVAANNADPTTYANSAVTSYPCTVGPNQYGNGCIWNGQQYTTFVGDKFSQLDLSQQETVLLHEMSHPYLGESDDPAGVDDPNFMYSPYSNAATGGIPGLCGTEGLPPTPPS